MTDHRIVIVADIIYNSGLAAQTHADVCWSTCLENELRKRCCRVVDFGQLSQGAGWTQADRQQEHDQRRLLYTLIEQPLAILRTHAKTCQR